MFSNEIILYLILFLSIHFLLYRMVSKSIYRDSPVKYLGGINDYLILGYIPSFYYGISYLFGYFGFILLFYIILFLKNPYKLFISNKLRKQSSILGLETIEESNVIKLEERKLKVSITILFTLLSIFAISIIFLI